MNEELEHWFFRIFHTAMKYPLQKRANRNVLEGVSLPFCTFLFFVLLAQAAFAEDTHTRTALERWIEGPVRYIITFKEEKAFMKLRTDSQRAYFIYRFWFKRDPTPGTFRNEYREIFWDRVITANHMFAESSTPGWKSDRGKIFTLLGPPDIIEKDAHPAVPFPPPGPPGVDKRTIVGSSTIGTERIISGPSPSSGLNLDTGFRGLERWIYSRSRGKDIPTNLIVAFYMSSSGEYKLSDNPQHYSQLFPGLDAAPDMSTRYGFPRDPVGSSSIRADILFTKPVDYMPPFSFENSIAFKLDLAEAIETPTVEDLIEETVSTSHFLNKLNVAFKAHYFLDISGNTYTVLQGIIPRKDIMLETDTEPALVSVFGRLERADRNDLFYSFSSDALVPGSVIEDRGDLVLLAHVTLPPGEYNARIGILNLPYGEAGNTEMRLDIPDLTRDSPALSSIIFSSAIEYEEKEAVSGEFASNIFIRPKAHSLFSKREEFGIYYVVYNLEKHGETDLPDFNIEYRFYRKEEGRYRALGKEIVRTNVQHEVQGWTFPLKAWPTGEFMLDITIFDTISGRSTSKSIEFSIL